ncbi:Trehalose utilization protein [Brachybacterium faecium]|uniref:Trehalose utilization protein n=1 Tax=Brachybacterium faecium (strain ATCC 43885 / DSM 4810 / JCM 11609 / LMG 19847 / NBRC 14762 / NCIMB 9860 / 6-10) TaxID=446465 RepID=C7MH31_BRAFD|nr:trehalose utilization protein ThuA [Brachybacterium faecium]ACU86479.1 trehalose utilization protein [Brachybacterium faecium DSM 4810]SLM89612.1 Trehalose utilization protein [Brachybacterium faecium]HJG51347.1 trehalose utilization protein ThuA [Brachybacterium faecium]
MTLRIAVFGENRHEKVDPKVQEVYPEGMHTVIADGLRATLAADGIDAEVRIALLDDIEESLSEEALAETDVLTWWGHMAHGDVPDEVSERVVRRVHEGMGLIPLHSAHYSKPFKALMGTTCNLLWRNDGEEERVWTVNGSHPIARGVPHPIVVPEQEMYGEMFDIPAPDELVFVSSFAGGEVFRSGAAFRRGKGKVFYFSPGDQEYPVYRQSEIQRVLANAVVWARPEEREAAPVKIANAQRDWFRDGAVDAQGQAVTRVI